MTETVVAETWKPVPHAIYAQCYEVSDLGRVRRALAAPCRKRAVPGKLLEGFVSKQSGLVHVTLRGERGEQGTFAVHRLVCEAFHGPPISGMVRAVHKTRALQDNRATNVTWSNLREPRVVHAVGLAPVVHQEDAEEWRPVVGYATYYEVSSFGRVRRVGSLQNLVGYPKPYPNVTLCVMGMQQTHAIHKLVCEAFHGPPPFPEARVRHLDDVRTNNRVDNLAWGTAKQNTADAIRNGKMHHGERNFLTKLTEEQVWEIKRLHREGWSQRAIADASKDMFGVKIRNTQVHHIVTGKQWRHVELDVT